MGTNIWFLQALSEYQVIETEGNGGVRPNFNSFYEKLDIFGFKITKKAAVKLKKYFEEHIDVLDSSERVGSERAKRIKSMANDVRLTFDAEAKCIFAHVLSEGRFGSEDLLENAWKFFADGVANRIEDIAISDIEEACKCIALQRPTAAAFHLMRATESVLRTYYCEVVKRGRGSLMWAPIVAHLRTRPRQTDVALLDHLDSIRRNFRNPTQHPEKKYDMSEVQDLFGVCIDVVNRMAAHLPERNAP
jgi:hypothetical protein